MIEMWLSYFGVGIAGGILAGLYGIGGGMVIVPSLMAVFAVQQVSPEVAMHLAVGTSLATISITGISSTWGHVRRGSVRRDWLMALLPGLVIGAVLGVFVAGALSGGRLGMLFGIFLLLVAMRLVLGRSTPANRTSPSSPKMITAGAVIGSVSALFGIGGGTLNVPWLLRCGASMTQAVGTSAACGLPIAVVGAVTFIITGWGNAQLPPGAIGFVMLPAFIGIVVTSVPSARVGVMLAHRLPSRVLKLSFAVLLTVVGLGFLI
ncbi:sulfite exporter TauE/SafE family protein [Halomonas binhaiensis]|uniref:Probable membrane transporter protein n=1 Tax=Halomonas binhaiensis TaxID=2562282 RepID=A0A5C1NBY6_9GAMM|nr:sulfite exporter TauE/SafE family protein [Halomonas binhaiensis]QEM80876.1 sulfite exporter TauE/SafE family protein [Halomonas binhaiensis]